MLRIMFIPNSLNQLKKFQAIVSELPADYTYVMVNLDKFKQSYTLETMKREKIPFVLFEKMDEREVERILDEQKSDILVVGNDTEVLSYLFIKGAKRKKLPVLLIQDGILSLTRTQMPLSIESTVDLYRTYSIIFLVKRLINKILNRHKIHVPQYGLYSDYIAVWGDFTKRLLIEAGIEKEKIVITGSPSMDSLKQKKFDRNKFLLKSGIDPHKKIVFFAASDAVGARLWTRKEFHDMIKSICEAVKQMKGTQLIIKLHPFHFGREPRYLDGFVDNKIIFSVNDADILDLFLVADVFLTDLSTTALEALAIGKPVGIVNLTGRPMVSRPYPEIYIQKKVALLIDREEDIKNKIETLLFDKKVKAELLSNSKSFVKDQLFDIDGKSAARIVKLINRIIKKKGVHSIGK